MLRGGFVEVQLSCWASWQEDGHRFIIAGEPASQLPRYVLVNQQLIDYDLTALFIGFHTKTALYVLIFSLPVFHLLNLN